MIAARVALSQNKGKALIKRLAFKKEQRVFNISFFAAFPITTALLFLSKFILDFSILLVKQDLNQLQSFSSKSIDEIGRGTLRKEVRNGSAILHLH